MNVLPVKGFTLIELLITLVIGVIVIMLSVPSYQLYLANNRVTALTNQFISATQFARSSAISRSTIVTLCAVSAEEIDTCASADEGNTAWTNGWFVFTDGGLASVIDGDDTILHRHYEVPLNTTLTGASRVVSYNAEGFLENAASGDYFATYVNCYANSRGRVIAISTAGRPSITNLVCEEEEAVEEAVEEEADAVEE